MPTLHFQCTFQIRGKRTGSKLADGPVSFVVASSGGAMATVTLDQHLEAVRVRLEDVTVDKSFLDWLQSANPTYANAYPDNVAAKIEDVQMALDVAARTVVEAVKYYLGKADIHDDVIGAPTAISWATDNSTTHPFPGLIQAFMSMSSEPHLSVSVREALQHGLDNGYRPLQGMRHLYRAIQETVPRFKWIDATIAAELAVKEALLRAHPELKTLLLNLPSPPLTKLYGEVLHEYLGERSPFLKDLGKGAERRNKLIHRADDEGITAAEAADYVQIVMKAIHHLYKLLYPGWKVNEVMSLIVHHK